MTTDNPRELRADAEMVRDGSRGKSCDRLADHIFATVRDDDGEEQTSTEVTTRAGDSVVVFSNSVRLYRDAMWLTLLDYRPTRGQFRALCRGLGIEVQ